MTEQQTDQQRQEILDTLQAIGDNAERLYAQLKANREREAVSGQTLEVGAMAIYGQAMEAYTKLLELEGTEEAIGEDGFSVR